MTKDERDEIERDLSMIFAEGFTFETACEQIDIEEGTPEFTFAKEVWDELEARKARLTGQ
jgi:ABC-type antimicrobial peptide transport system ATPase subunit